MVQLSAMLALVPLALENTYLQASEPGQREGEGEKKQATEEGQRAARAPKLACCAHRRAAASLPCPVPQVLVARSCLPPILAALQLHAGEAEVVSKALICLGVLGQVRPSAGCPCRPAARPPPCLPARGRAACPTEHAGVTLLAMLTRAPTSAAPSALALCARLQGDEEAHEAIRATIMERTPFPCLVADVLSGPGTLRCARWQAAAWGHSMPLAACCLLSRSSSRASSSASAPSSQRGRAVVGALCAGRHRPRHQPPLCAAPAGAGGGGRAARAARGAGGLPSDGGGAGHRARRDGELLLLF